MADMSDSATKLDEAPFRATIEEYLDFEYHAKSKHEWRDGIVTAMAGGSVEQALISANAIRAIGNRLPSDCRVYTSDLRIRSLRSSLYHYPDITIVCGPPEYDPQDKHKQTIVNPKAIIEILSASTEADDRGTKFERYRAIESFEEYVLVSPGLPKVEQFHRNDDGLWVINPFVDGLGATAHLQSVGIDLPLAEIYANVEFNFPPDDDEDRVEAIRN